MQKPKNKYLVVGASIVIAIIIIVLVIVLPVVLTRKSSSNATGMDHRRNLKTSVITCLEAEESSQN